MKHSRMELMLIIGANEKNLNDVDRSKIIARTHDIYPPSKKEEKLNHRDIFHNSDHDPFDEEIEDE